MKYVQYTVIQSHTLNPGTMDHGCTAQEYILYLGLNLAFEEYHNLASLRRNQLNQYLSQLNCISA